MNRDPPAATLQESYPNKQEEEEGDDEEEDMEGSFIKLEESHSVEEPSEQNIKQEDQGEDEDLALPMLGGEITSKAYCLLDGIFEVRRWTRVRSFLKSSAD